MDCREFDGQVVRLESLADVADEFVRVRLDRIESSDLNIFDFDYDLTFAVFFLDAKQQVYARYGGRDANSADARQSLAGLRHVMATVLETHRGDAPTYATRRNNRPRFIRESPTFAARGGCIHCHQVNEILNAQLVQEGHWSRSRLWRYPLPDNLGAKLSVDDGRIIESVTEASPAAAAGLAPGDVLLRLGDVPIHSLADAQFALDAAPDMGLISASWLRGEQVLSGSIALPDGWRRSDILWRRSLQEHVPHFRLNGNDLTADEKRELGLPERRMAFRQQATPADNYGGIREGDIILDVDGRQLELDAYDLREYIARRYVCGEQVVVDFLRDGRRQQASVELNR